MKQRDVALIIGTLVLVGGILFASQLCVNRQGNKAFIQVIHTRIAPKIYGIGDTMKVTVTPELPLQVYLSNAFGVKKVFAPLGLEWIDYVVSTQLNCGFGLRGYPLNKAEWNPLDLWKISISTDTNAPPSYVLEPFQVTNGLQLVSGISRLISFQDGNLELAFETISMNPSNKQGQVRRLRLNIISGKITEDAL